MKEHFEFEGFNDDLFLDKKENYSNFAIDPATAVIEAGGKTIEAFGKGAEAVGKIAETSARKKEAEAKIIEIGGKRQAQFKQCEDNKAYKKFLDSKYRRNRINDCQAEVKKRLDAEENEQKEIVKRLTAIEEGKLTGDLKKSEFNVNEKKSSKKLYVYAGVLGLFMVLGVIVYLKKKS